MELPVLKRAPVIHIGLGNNEFDNFGFVIDYQMQLKAKEPAHCRLALGCYALKDFVGMFPFNVADPYGRRIHERDTRAVAQAAQLEENHQWQQYLGLQFYETVIGYCLGKILPAMVLYVVDIEELYIPAVSFDEKRSWW